MGGYFLFCFLGQFTAKTRDKRILWQLVSVVNLLYLVSVLSVFYLKPFPLAISNFTLLFSNRGRTLRSRPSRPQSYHLILNLPWLLFSLSTSSFAGLCIFVIEQHSH